MRSLGRRRDKYYEETGTKPVVNWTTNMHMNNIGLGISNGDPNRDLKRLWGETVLGVGLG